jgi:hypothetical protein
MGSNQISVTLTRSEGLVLFEWVASLNSKTDKPVVDAAEQAVLWRVEAQLEKNLEEIFSPDYDKLLASAKQQILEYDK